MRGRIFSSNESVSTNSMNRCFGLYWEGPATNDFAILLPLAELGKLLELSWDLPTSEGLKCAADVGKRRTGVGQGRRRGDYHLMGSRIPCWHVIFFHGLTVTVLNLEWAQGLVGSDFW